MKQQRIHLSPTMTILLTSEDFDYELDMDRITKIDYSNLYGEAVTVDALMNRIGIIQAEAEYVYNRAVLDAEIYEANLKKTWRIESLTKKVVIIEGEEIKITENSIKELVLADEKLLRLKRNIIEAKKDYEFIKSLYWSVSNKSKKLNTLLPKVTPEEFFDGIIAGSVNTYTIQKL